MVDGLLAYDRGCREGDRGAAEFLGLLDIHDERRRALEQEAETADCPVAGLEDYRAWREMSERLSANGRALLEDAGARAGEAGPEIAGRLDRLDEMLLVDKGIVQFMEALQDIRDRAQAAGTIPYYVSGHDALLEVARALAAHRIVPVRVKKAVEEVIAEAEACDERRAEIFALTDEAAELWRQRARLERLARNGPPSLLEDWPAWSERNRAAAERWREIEDGPDVWRPHLERLRGMAVPASIMLRDLARLREHDPAWADLYAARRTIVLQARDAGRARFYHERWDGFVDEVRTFAGRRGLSGAAAAMAKRVLAHDRNCREARTAIADFLKGAREHKRRWDILEGQCKRRRRQRPNLSIADYRGYRPLSGFAKALMETAEPFLGEGSRRRHGVDFDGAWDGGACIAAELERLRRHEPLNGFRNVMDRLDKVRRESEAGNVLAFHHDDWPGIVGKAEQLKEDEALGAAERRRLQAVLDEHADRAAEWEIVEILRREWEELKEEERDLSEKAEREGLPATLLPEWQDCLSASRHFAAEAGAVLADADLRRNGHWRSCPEVQTLLEEAGEAARDLGRLPETEEALVTDMIRVERARLRDPQAKPGSESRWRLDHQLVEGDRLRVSQHPRLPDGEAVVIATGLAGGLSPRDELELEWIASERTRKDPYEDIRADELAEAVVWRADWSHEELRNAALMREQPRRLGDFPILCDGDVVAGDVLYWTETIPPGLSAEGRPLPTDRPETVHVQAELVERRAAEVPMADTCILRETWRSDDRPCRERGVALATLTAGCCMRAGWWVEEEREAHALSEDRRLGEMRLQLRQVGPHLRMQLGTP